MSGRARHGSAHTARAQRNDPPLDGLDAAQARRMRQLVKVAHMYHERGMRQSEIAQQLDISQSRVSRLLQEAARVGVVRTAVVSPRGVHTVLEQEIEDRYSLREAVVVELPGQEESQVIAALGAAAAVYLESRFGARQERIGISSWSSTLLAMVEVMQPFRTPVAAQVVQVLGGLGDVSAQSHATRLVERMARLTGARAVLLAAPGLVASKDLRDALVNDDSLRTVLSSYTELTMLLTGIGSIRPSPLLRESGNALRSEDEQQLMRLGAVGDVCLHYFDADGDLVASELEDRLIGIEADSLKVIPRRIGVAGGERKHDAIRAALRGHWIDVLITDAGTAHALLVG